MTLTESVGKSKWNLRCVPCSSIVTQIFMFLSQLSSKRKDELKAIERLYVLYDTLDEVKALKKATKKQVGVDIVLCDFG
jgi:hypothetical protein